MNITKNDQKSEDEHLRKVVGGGKEKDPLKRLEAIYRAVRKLDCTSKLDDSQKYRKIVGRIR